ncbi:MAG: hypothetical protein ACRD3N_05020 [Terracidiphilus sp.]
MRSSSRIFWFVLLAALAAALSAAPRRAAAQQSAPAASSAANASASQNPSGGDQPQSESDEINGYLHSSTVRAVAKVLHLSLRAADYIFLGINFAVIFLAIAIPLGRGLPKIMRKRSATLRESIDSARKLTDDANARLAAVEAQMGKLGDEIEKFRAEIEEELKSDEVRIKGSIAEESARIVAAAEQEIGVAALQARRGLRTFAAELAIDHASRQLVLTPETDRALIAEFAGNVQENHLGVKENHLGAKGGQN